MQCAYILGLAARHITTTRPFVIVPAAANPGNDKHPAGKNKLLIERWIFTRIAPTCTPLVQELKNVDRRFVATEAIRIFN